MSSLGNHWNSTPKHHNVANGVSLFPNGKLRVPSRSRTPNLSSEHANASQLSNAPEPDSVPEENPRLALFARLYSKSDAKVDALFGAQDEGSKHGATRVETEEGDETASHSQLPEPVKTTPKSTTRKINEDDYDDSDGEDDAASDASPLKSRSTGSIAIPRISSPAKAFGSLSTSSGTILKAPSPNSPSKHNDDVRKKLEEDIRAAEDEAKQRFQLVFYPVTNDKDAMIEQQELEESDRQVDVELSGMGNAAAANVNKGTLSSANLGASSLVLKHLIARIDAKREAVRASDQDLRALMIEVKKNRSKWASEDRVGQEELYEAAEKVLSEVKAKTEHSGPFLQKVSKREAPDYYTSEWLDPLIRVLLTVL